MIALLFILASWTPSANGAVSWQMQASKLTGYSEAIRNEALVALKKTPQIQDKLKAALTTSDRYLALDVMSALGLHSMVGHLLEVSEKGDDGAIHLTINTLVSGDNIQPVLEKYVLRLRRSQAPAVKVAILDYLGRLGHRLGEADLAALARSSSFEVRSAALYYARLMLGKLRKADYYHVFRRTLQDAATPLRIQTIYTLQELPFETPAEWKNLEVLCSKDPVEEVRRLCKELRG